MPQPFVPLAIEPEPPFWPRLAKGAVLILVGVAAHQWLLPAQDGNVPEIAIVRLDAPREAAAATSSAAPREEVSAGEIRLVPTGTGGAPADATAVHLTPVATSGKASEARTQPRARSSSTGAASLASAPARQTTERPSDVVREEPSIGAGANVEVVVPAARAFSAELTLASLSPMRGPALPAESPDAEPVHDAAAAPGRATPPLVVEDGDLERRVLRIVQEYRAAYESLDVAAARTVWPSVDHVALTHAFRQLAAQRLTFESCGISVSGASALARCRGQAEYIPKVGAQRALMASGEWVFDLSRHDTDDWKIVSASVH